MKKIYKIIYLAIGLIIPFLLGFLLTYTYHHYTMRYFNQIPSLILTILFYLIIGAYLGFFQFMRHLFNKNEKWKINFTKIIFTIFFFALFALSEFLYYFKDFPYCSDAFLVFTGYFLITAFEKKPEENQ